MGLTVLFLGYSYSFKYFSLPHLSLSEAVLSAAYLNALLGQ